MLESSRRARGFAVWAALRELGRDGVADLVDRCCGLARRFADGLAAGGAEIVNDVVLNQVLVGFGTTPAPTRSSHGSAARRHLLAGRHHLARPAADADLGVELVDHRGRRGPVGRGNPADRGRRSRAIANEGAYWS